MTRARRSAARDTARDTPGAGRGQHGRIPPGAIEQAAADRLRALIREAHEAAQELRDATREARAVAATAERAAHDAIMERITAGFLHLQDQFNDAAAQLNASVNEARGFIVSQLSKAAIWVDDETGEVTIEFPARKFDEEGKLTVGRR